VSAIALTGVLRRTRTSDYGTGAGGTMFISTAPRTVVASSTVEVGAAPKARCLCLCASTHRTTLWGTLTGLTLVCGIPDLIARNVARFDARVSVRGFGTTVN